MALLLYDEAKTQLTLDQGVPVVINLQDPTGPPPVPWLTENSAIRWGQKGLSSDFEHSLDIQVAPGSEGWAVVDMLL